MKGTPANGILQSKILRLLLLDATLAIEQLFLKQLAGVHQRVSCPASVASCASTRIDTPP